MVGRSSTYKQPSVNSDTNLIITQIYAGPLPAPHPRVPDHKTKLHGNRSRERLVRKEFTFKRVKARRDKTNT